jgi:hypothetical protein
VQHGQDGRREFDRNVLDETLQGADPAGGRADYDDIELCHWLPLQEADARPGMGQTLC